MLMRSILGFITLTKKNNIDLGLHPQSDIVIPGQCDLGLHPQGDIVILGQWMKSCIDRKQHVAFLLLYYFSIYIQLWLFLEIPSP